jgi:hypothetical protein
MFGAHTGISDEIILPKGILESNRREILEWERELIGLYVSDHPLSPVMDALTQAVTHFSAQLSDATPGEKVRVAGIVTRVRPHQTKTGKSMGFVTLEDLQGNIELVVFPRTWEQFWDVFEVDSVVLMDGKVDAQSGDPKVLVDTVTTDLKAIVARPIPTPMPATLPSPSRPSPQSFVPSAQVNEPTAQPEDWGEVPPPPDEFPPEWKAHELTPGGFVIEGVVPTIENGIAAVITEVPVTSTEVPVTGTETHTRVTEIPATEVTNAEVPTFEAPVPSAEVSDALLNTEVPTFRTEVAILGSESAETTNAEAPNGFTTSSPVELIPAGNGVVAGTHLASVPLEPVIPPKAPVPGAEISTAGSEKPALGTKGPNGGTTILPLSNEPSIGGRF